MKVKTRNLFFELKRVEDDPASGHMIVEGYTFVNPDAGDGFVWQRSAMEAATPDYEAWGAVREMHQPSAVGTAKGEGLGITWDANGAFLRAMIVDEGAKEKVRTGVYQGFSARIRPTLMRGRTVSQCEWVENSLVDRPQDKGCPIESFTVYRAEGVEQADEVEVPEESPVADSAVPVEPEPAAGEATIAPMAVTDDPAPDPAPELGRASFDEYMKDYEPSVLRGAALDWLWNSLWDIQWLEGGDKAELVRQTCDEFRDYMVAVVERQEMGEKAERGTSNIEGALVRIAGERGDLRRALDGANLKISALTLERDEKATELARVSNALQTAEGRVKELEEMPNPGNAPVRYPVALERTVNNPLGEITGDAKDELQEELKRISKGTYATDEEQRAAVAKMQVLKHKIASR